MQSYVLLMTLTERGAREIAGTIDRSRRIRALLEQRGINLASLYWTQGRFDLVAFVEAPDDQVAMGALMSITDAGFVRTETLRAFTEPEMEAILEQL